MGIANTLIFIMDGQEQSMEDSSHSSQELLLLSVVFMSPGVWSRKSYNPVINLYLTFYPVSFEDLWI